MPLAIQAAGLDLGKVSPRWSLVHRPQRRRGAPRSEPCATSTYPPIIATAKTAFRLLGQRFQMTGTEHVPRTGGALLAFNHIGYVDFVYGGLAAQPSRRLVRFMAKREIFDHRVGGPADAVAAPHRGRPGRGPGVVPTRRWSTCRPARRSGSSPRRRSPAAMELKEFKTGAIRIAAAAGVPADPRDPVGHPADDDQGPPAGLLPWQDDRDHGRRAAAPRPARTRSPRPPSCTSVMSAMLDEAIRDYPADEQPPGAWWVPARARRQRPDARRRPPASTPRRSAQRAAQASREAEVRPEVALGCVSAL